MRSWLFPEGIITLGDVLRFWRQHPFLSLLFVGVGMLIGAWIMRMVGPIG
jgi:hypothetical protein